MMSTASNPTGEANLAQCAQRMQREAYELAGAEARSLGVAREDNPFLRKTYGPLESDRMKLLAGYWWKGWDDAPRKRR